MKFRQIGFLLVASLLALAAATTSCNNATSCRKRAVSCNNACKSCGKKDESQGKKAALYENTVSSGEKRNAARNKKAAFCKNKKAQIGVFDGHGGAQTCIWEAVAAVSLDPDMSVRTITTSDIAGGVLKKLDAVIIPGGGGTTQYLNFWEKNIESLREFIKSGKGALGICAGAYLFSDTPDYACMRINGAKAIDIEHDNRGHGVSNSHLPRRERNSSPNLQSGSCPMCFITRGRCS